VNLPIPASDLVARVVRTAAAEHRRHPRRSWPLWSYVGDLFACGSTYAREICRACCVDPDSGAELDAFPVPAPQQPRAES